MATATVEQAVVPNEPRRLYSFFRQYPAIAGVVSACIGATVLIGWIADVHVITLPLRGIPITVANSALMDLCVGVALWLAARRRWGPPARVASRTFAAFAALIAYATLFEYVAHVDLGIDRIIADIHHEPWPISRPSPYTATGLALVATALLMPDRKTRHGRYVADYCALGAQALAFSAVLGYLFGASVLYEMPNTYIGMSPTNVLVTLVMSMGILGLHVEDGMLSIVLAPDAGGAVARQLLLALALFPPIAVIVVIGARLGWYALPLAAAVTLLLALAETTAFILRTASRLSRTDTAQRQLHEQQRLSESRMRALVDEAKDGIFISNAEGRYIDVNPAGCALSGYTREALLGMTIADLVAPDELAKVTEESEVVRSGKTSRREWRLQRKDGSLLDVEVVAHLLADGRWQAFVRDISERKHYERAIARALETEQKLRADLQRSYAWLQAVLDQLPEGVMVVDEQENVIVINRALRLWAANPDLPAATAFANPAMFDVRDASGDIIPFDTLPMPRVFRTGEATQDEELLLRQADGSLLPVDVRAAPVRDDSGKLTGVIAVARNAVERKELERLREEWIAVVAHDLRQPVQAIVFSFDSLYEHASEQDRALLQRVRTSAFHLNRMVDDLLDAARIAVGRLAVEPTYGDICRIVEDEIERIQLTNPKANIHFDRPLEQVAWVDPERIHQVLANLLSNAIKYRTPGTPVHVEIARIAEGVRVTVTNEGTTIEPDDMARLFGRFVRTRSGRGKRGVGLGLYICKALVEAHGGRIWAESAEGWTRFHFTLKVPELPTFAARPR